MGVGLEARALARQEADGDHVALDHPADRGQDRGDIAPLHPCPAAGIEDGLQLLDHEAHVAAAAEDGGNHPRQRDGPGVMLHVLRVDEDLEGTPPAAIVDVVDGDVDRVLAAGELELVGRAPQRHRTVHRLVQRRGRGGGLVHRQDGPRDLVRAIGGAALAALVPGGKVDVLEGFEGNVLGAVDRLGNRAVHPFLRRRLHGDVVQRRQRLGVHEPVGEGRLAHAVAPQPGGVIDDLLLGAGAVLLQDLAGVAVGEDRLDPRTDVARVKADRAGRGHACQQGVADAVGADGLAHVLVHLQHEAGRQVGLGVEQREGALFAGEAHAGQIGRPRDAVHPLARRLGGLGRAIAQADHHQRVGKPRHAEPDAALGLRLGRLLGQGKARSVHDVVHHPHGGRDQVVQRIKVQRGFGSEGVLHQPREVDRAQKAGAIGRQGLFAAGVGGRDILDIAEVVHPVYAVDEDHAGFGIVIGGAHDPVPQIAGADRPVGAAPEDQRPVGVGLSRLHEGVRHKHRQVEHPQPRGVLLGGDEILDVGVVAAHRGHHGAPARARRHDRAAHGVPDVHEAQRPRGVGGDALHLGPLGADGREVVADPAALLHGQGGFLQRLEDARHAVGDRAHDEAVEQRDRAPRARARHDPARRQEAEILERGVEAAFPLGGIGLDRGEVAGHAAPCLLDGRVQRRAVGGAQPVFHVPDLFGDGGGEAVHPGNLSGMGVSVTSCTRRPPGASG